MSVVVVGSVALDDIRTPFGKGRNVLGGSASYFSLAASRFAPVRIVAVVGDDFPASHLELLESRGIGVDGVAREAGPSFFWSGSYSRDLKEATTHETRLGVFETFDPVLGEQERDAPCVFLANIDPDLQLKVLDQVREPRMVVLDTMNFWITGKPESLRKVLARVHYVLMNDEELRLITGDHNLIRASRRLLDMGPRGVVIKKGEHGAFLRTADDMFAIPSFPTEEVHDPTGAGDSFAGGFVGWMACAREPDAANTIRLAVAHGVAMASFTVEAFSVEGLLAATRENIDERVASLHELTRWSHA